MKVTHWTAGIAGVGGVREPEPRSAYRAASDTAGAGMRPSTTIAAVVAAVILSACGAGAAIAGYPDGSGGQKIWCVDQPNGLSCDGDRAIEKPVHLGEKPLPRLLR